MKKESLDQLELCKSITFEIVFFLREPSSQAHSICIGIDGKISVVNNHSKLVHYHELLNWLNM